MLLHVLAPGGANGSERRCCSSLLGACSTFNPSLLHPITLCSCPCGLGCVNSLSALTSTLERTSQRRNPLITCCTSQGRRIILVGHASLLGANPGPASLCLELAACRRAGDRQGVWLGASENRLWSSSKSSSSGVPGAWALLATLEESNGVRAGVWSTALPSGPAPGGLCSL